MKIVAVRFVLFSRVEMFLFPLVFHNFFITRVLSFCCNSTASVFFLLREFASNREIQCLAGFLKCVVLREFCSMFCEFRRKHFFFTKMRHICSRESVQHFTLWLFCSGFFSCQSGLGCLPSATEFFPLQKDLLAFVTRLRQTFERGKMFNIFPRLFTLHLSSGLLFTVRFRNCFVLFCCVWSFFFLSNLCLFLFSTLRISSLRFRDYGALTSEIAFFCCALLSITWLPFSSFLNLHFGDYDASSREQTFCVPWLLYAVVVFCQAGTSNFSCLLNYEQMSHLPVSFFSSFLQSIRFFLLGRKTG